MKIDKLFLLFSVTFSAWNVSAQVVRKCQSLHTPLAPAAQAYAALMSGKDTTGVRGEAKRVLDALLLDDKVRTLLEANGFKRRDAVIPGTKNITQTDYMPVFTFTMDGIRLAEKNRFRKYLVKKGDEMIPAKGYEDRSWFENKIDHPNYPGRAVFKPRVLVLDADIPLLIHRDSFRQHRQAIEQRLLAINAGTAEARIEIQKMLHGLEMRFRATDSHMDGMFVRTEYERASYSLPLQSKSQPNAKMDVQVTVDKDVVVTDLRNGNVYHPYQANEAVLEWKTPIGYFNYSKADLADAPSLAIFLPFIEFANQNHVGDYIQDKGKMSQLKRFTEIPKQIAEVIQGED